MKSQANMSNTDIQNRFGLKHWEAWSDSNSCRALREFDPWRILSFIRRLAKKNSRYPCLRYRPFDQSISFPTREAWPFPAMPWRPSSIPRTWGFRKRARRLLSFKLNWFPAKNQAWMARNITWHRPFFAGMIWGTFRGSFAEEVVNRIPTVYVCTDQE